MLATRSFHTTDRMLFGNHSSNNPHIASLFADINGTYPSPGKEIARIGFHLPYIHIHSPRVSSTVNVETDNSSSPRIAVSKAWFSI